MESCFSALNALMKSNLPAIKSCDVLSCLSNNLELLVGIQCQLDDSHPERTSSTSSRLEEWRLSMMSLGDECDNLLSKETRKSLSNILDTIFWSITCNPSIIEELDKRIQRYRKEMERALRSHETFVGHLTGHLDDELDIIKATVEAFQDGEDLSPWSLGCHKNHHQLLLVEKQIDIWTKCLPNHRELHPPINTKDPSTFLKVLLTSSSLAVMKPRLAIAAELLCDHLDTPENADDLEHWVSLLERFDKDKDTGRHLAAVQASLVGHFSVFRLRQLVRHTEKNRQSIKFNSKEIVHHLNIISRFLGESEVEINRLLLVGLVRFVKDLDRCFREEERLCASYFLVDYLQHLFIEMKIIAPKKRDILYALYSVADEKGKLNKLTEEERHKLFSVHEKAYMERWLQTEVCYTDSKPFPRVTALLNQIQEIVNEESKQPTFVCPSSSQNRLISAAGLDLLFTAEEKKYVAITGKEVAELVFCTQQPIAYLSTLQEKAVVLIYRNLILHFHSDNKEELIDLLQTYRPGNLPEQCEAGSIRESVAEFQRAFDRAYFFVKKNETEFEWLLWLQETVLKSLKSIPSDRMQLAAVTELISATAEFNLEELYISTATSRPQRWVDDILVGSIVKAIAKQPLKGSGEEQMKNQRLSLTSDLQQCLNSGRELLKVLLDKLKREARLIAATEPIDLDFISKLIGDIKDLGQIEVDRYRDSSIRQWPRIIRHAKLAKTWPSGLASQLTIILDRRLGLEKTERFLQRFQLKFQRYNSVQQQNILEEMLKNLSKYPWIVDQFFTLAREDDNDAGEDDDNYLWQLVQKRDLIEADRIKASQSNLEASQLLRTMKNDPESRAIVGGSQQQKKLIQQIEDIKSLALNEPRNQWKLQEIMTWTKQVKESKESLDPVDFLSVAFQAVKLTKNHGLRDAQMLAILIFVSSSGDGKVGRRMAQISTGEGKTLITALLVVYHVLSNWSAGRRFVDIITSSSVLAEGNVAEVKWFYDIFGVGVENNCDEACSQDEKLRSRRYNTDVIYGDLSSFQRDILLSRFFSDRDITRNRRAGAIVVDEVDSMLLDKGENILYLSHKIPEMDDLLNVFVEIWNAVHAPDAIRGDESGQALVYQFVKTRIDQGEIVVPKCLDSFVRRHLLVWTRNAFRAKYLVTTKDSYKIDDVGDGRGQQVVIMDKETGVEQVQMQWSNGLHQFLQLKHTLKLSPISLKAVFMSNIGFFEQRKEVALYGMTGTLGSTAECQLLHEVFQVDFFKMPRFKRRFCLEEDHLLAPTQKQWLDNVAQATKTQVEKNRAVLVVCENIKAAEAVYDKLSRQKETCKIVKYVSSFDTEFQKKQHDTALTSGDVIVATNLAGRGTDLKISDQLAQNGGLHVIIGYMPANARVEAQIEGRVARAGQPGSFQFVVCHPSVNEKESDTVSELSRLKVLRDDRECRRLENIRTQGLQKIFLEEKLFDRFHKEIYDQVQKTLTTNKNPDSELQMKFLTNRWALWLDENAEHIENVHLRKSDVVEKNFEKFKNDCLVLLNHNVGSANEAIRFASTPSELLKLGEFLEKSGKTEDITKSRRCYEQVAKDEPKTCEVAWIRRAKLVLQAADVVKKKEGKLLLIQAKKLISEKVERLSSANDLIKNTAKSHQKAGGAVGENRFEEQITNYLSLLQVHLTSIDDLLGRPVHQSLAMQFTKEEESKDLIAALTDNLEGTSLCKPFRLSKKIRTDDDDAIWMEYDSKNKKMIEWPSAVAHCQKETVDYIKRKLKTNSRSLKKSEFKDVVVTQHKLWQDLIKSGYVGQEVITDRIVIRWANQKIESDEDIKKFLQDLPPEMGSHKTVLVGWLQEHDGEEFKTVVSPLQLSGERLKSLQTFLTAKKILVHVNERKGNILKTMTFKLDQKSSVVDLPDELKRYEHLISAWILADVEELSTETVDKSAGVPASREELPCPKDEVEAVDQVWNLLLSQGVIKDRTLRFPKGMAATKDEISARFTEIKETIKSLPAIEEICRKYSQPVDDVTKASYTDYPSYWSYKAECAANYINPFAADEQKRSGEDEDINKWLTDCKKKEQLESYRTEVVSALTNSLGQLKTIPAVSASFQPLNKYFMAAESGTYPAEEIQSFTDKTFDKVIKLEAYKSWWDYWDCRAFYVALMGIGQIVIGVAITALSGGTLAILGNAFIAEGVGDLIFAIQSGLTGTFSWDGYKSHKKWSLAMTVFSAGLGAYLTKGAAVGRVAAYGFQGKVGLSLLLAAGKKVMAKCGQAVLSALSSMGAEKLLSWLKKFVIENILVHIKWLISKILSPLFTSLANTLEKLWNLMKEKGRQLGQAMGLINANIDKAGKSELATLWGRRMAGQAASVGSAIGRCFSESRDVLSADGQNSLLGKGQEEGFDVLKKSFKFVTYAEKAMKIVSWLKNGSEIVGLIGYAPEYVYNVEKILSAEVKRLEEEVKEDTKEHVTEETLMPEETKDELQIETETTESAKMYNTSVESERETFNKYKEEVTKRVETEIVTHMVDSVTKTWVQPWLQSKIESLVMYAGSKTFDCISNLWQGSPSTEKQEGSDVKSGENEAQNEKAEASKKELDGILGADGCEVQVDSNGNVVVQPKTYKNLVDNLGEGRAAGLLEIQMVADACGCEIDIVNYGAEGKNFSVSPDGKTSTKIQVVYTTNEDGTNHVSLMGPDGKAIELPSSVEGSPSAANRCLYEAVAQARQCPVDQLLKDVKAHAMNNKQTQYLYNERVDEALPDRRVGRDSTGQRADIYFIKDEFGGIRNVIATITKDNLKGGSDVTGSMGKELKKVKHPNDQLGHLLAFVLGGGGGKKENNVVAMDAKLNQGPYKEAELKLLAYIRETPTAKVYVNIRLNEGIEGFVDPRRPVNLRISWHGVAGDTTTYYRSPLFENKEGFASEFKQIPRNERGEIYDTNKDYNLRSIELPENSRSSSNVGQQEPILFVPDSKTGKVEGEVIHSSKYKNPLTIKKQKAKPTSTAVKKTETASSELPKTVGQLLLMKLVTLTKQVISEQYFAVLGEEERR